MNQIFPDTRISMILRLRGGQDEEAWSHFTEIYRPLVFRLARAKGFQDADAQEIVQEVMVAVLKAVERWNPDDSQGRFRDWLFTISRNLMINFMTRPRHRPIGTGISGLTDLLENQALSQTQESSTFDLEYRREVFHWAANRVRTRVKNETWLAFWKTAVESESPESVAEQLGMTVGTVYVARSRVIAKLAEETKTFVKQSQP